MTSPTPINRTTWISGLKVRSWISHLQEEPGVETPTKGYLKGSPSTKIMPRLSHQPGHSWILFFRLDHNKSLASLKLATYKPDSGCTTTTTRWALANFWVSPFQTNPVARRVRSWSCTRCWSLWPKVTTELQPCGHFSSRFLGSPVGARVSQGNRFTNGCNPFLLGDPKFKRQETPGKRWMMSFSLGRVRLDVLLKPTT